MGKKKRKYDKGASVGFLMALPTVLGLILLNIYPLCRTVYMSFFKSGAFGKWTFVGLDNYVTMFQSAGFWTVTKIPCYYVTDSACNSCSWFADCSIIKSEYQW